MRLWMQRSSSGRTGGRSCRGWCKAQPGRVHERTESDHRAREGHAAGQEGHPHPARQAGLGNTQARRRVRASDGPTLHPLHLKPVSNPAPGRSVDDYEAPLFLAWQLTNRCSARCLACCEESGPDRAWRDELTPREALDLATAIAEAGIAYVAFGGGEPLGAPPA